VVAQLHECIGRTIPKTSVRREAMYEQHRRQGTRV